MEEDRRRDVLKRLSYIEGHVSGIRTSTRSHKTLPVIEANRLQCNNKILPFLLFDGTVRVDSCLFQ